MSAPTPVEQAIIDDLIASVCAKLDARPPRPVYDAAKVIAREKITLGAPGLKPPTVDAIAHTIALRIERWFDLKAGDPA